MKINLEQVKRLPLEEKRKVFKELKKTIEGEGTNVEKVAKVQRIIIRVTDEQKQAFKELSKETKVPLSTIVRKSLNAVIKQRTTCRKLTPDERRLSLKAFQRKMGLID